MKLKAAVIIIILLGSTSFVIPTTGEVKSSGIQRIFVVFTSHIDAGWNHPIDEMEQWCKTIIDDAIEKCERYDDFCWTIENIWELKNWLDRTTKKEEVNRLFDLIREGRIEVGAAWDDDLSGFFGMEDVNRLFYFHRWIERGYNIDFQTVVMNDIPGYTWSLPQAMNGSGLKYFLTGINPFEDMEGNKYWGAGVNISFGDLPFYWCAPDGSRILTWIAFDGYGGGWWLASSSYEEMKELAFEIIRMYEDVGFGAKYDAILVMLGADCINCSRAVNALENIRRWNSEGNKPEIIPATPKDFFQYMERRYGGCFSVYSGDWTDTWDMNKQIAYPYGTSIMRWARDHILVAEKIWSINSLLFEEDYLGEEFFDTYKLYFTWLDHTESVWTPPWFTREEIERDARLRHSLAVSFKEKVEDLLESGFEKLVSEIETEGECIIVFNPLSWRRTDIVEVPLNQTIFSRNFEVMDCKEKEIIPYQKIEERSSIVFIASDVPPIGYKKYEIVFTEEPLVFPTVVNGSDCILENRFYRIVADETSGCIEGILDKTTGRELVNRDSDYKFNGFYGFRSWRVSQGIDALNVTIDYETGPVYGKMIIEREGTPIVRTEYTLYSEFKRIDVTNYIDKSYLCDPRVRRNLTCIAYPFNLDIDDLEVETERAYFFLPCSGEKHLPGAYKRVFYNQHSIDLNEKNSFGISIATKQTYVNSIVENGAFPENPREWSPSEATWLELVGMGEREYKSIDQGIIKVDWEPGSPQVRVFEYTLKTYLGSFNSTDAYRFGWEFNVPLLARLVSGEQYGLLKSPSLSFFSIDKPNIAIVTIKKPEDGLDDFIIRLQEFSGVKTHFKLYLPFKIKKMVVTNIVEENIVEENETKVSNPLDLTINPYQTLTLRFSVKKGVRIEKPRERDRYISGKGESTFLSTLVIGGITVKAMIYGLNDTEKVEFYVDDRLRFVDTEEAFKWIWDEFIIGLHRLKVVAYNEVERKEDELNLQIFNLKGVIE